MNSTLKDRAITGLVWSGVEKFGQQGISFAVALLLARILLPKDFGVFSILMILVGLGQLFMDSGFTLSLIQKQDTDQTDYSTIFFAVFINSVLFYSILFVLSPLIAIYFNETALTVFIRIIGLSIIVNSLGTVHYAQMVKTFDFKAISKATIFATFVGGVIAIIFAQYGFGVWSLVIQILTIAFFKNLLFWKINNWRPSFLFSLKAFKPLFNYSSKIFAAGLLNWAFDNLYKIAIGKLFTTKDLGFYSQARRFQEFPSKSAGRIIQSIAFPAFSSIQNDVGALKKAFLKSLSLSAFALTPIMITLLLYARPIIRIVLTDKWIDSAIYLELLSIVGLLFPLQSINLNLIKAIGKSSVFLNIEVIKKIVIILTFVIGLKYGIYGIVASQVVASFINLQINSYYPNRHLSLNFLTQMQILFRFVLIYSFINLVTRYTFQLLFIDSKISLFLQVLISFFIYAYAVKILNTSTYITVKDILSKVLK